MEIKRLSRIDDIGALKKRYMEKYKTDPINVSDWAISKEFYNRISGVLNIHHDNSIIDYIYSYSLNRQVISDIQNKTGDMSSERTCIVFPNNTISIVNICNLLRAKNLTKVAILQPAYFSIEFCLDTYHISHYSFCVMRENGYYSVPIEKIINSGCKTIFLTSPIYSTGIYYSPSEILKIEQLLNNGFLVVADESFCLNGNELISRLYDYNNFIGIYSPHKSIGINGLKFSIVDCHIQYWDFFEQWLDVLCGNLPFSTLSAISHFLSDNYVDCMKEFLAYTSSQQRKATNILQMYHNVEYDKSATGSLLTVYIKNMTCGQISDLSYIESVLAHAHALYYPGSLNGFSSEIGACFRINMTLSNSDFLGGLARILDYLQYFS